MLWGKNGENHFAHCFRSKAQREELVQMQKKFDEELAAKQKQADTLRKQLQNTQAKLKAKGEKNAGATIAECDADEGMADTPSAHLGHITQARDGSMPSVTWATCKSHFPDYEATLAAAETKLHAAHVAKRAANPFKEQLESADAYQARAKKKLEDAKAESASRTTRRSLLAPTWERKKLIGRKRSLLKRQS